VVTTLQDEIRAIQNTLREHRLEITAVEKALDIRAHKLDERVDQAEAALDKLDGRLDKLDKKVDKICRAFPSGGIPLGRPGRVLDNPC
jgi:chromosome segregation ATPase